MERFYDDCLTIGEAETIALWLIEEAKTSECYKEQMSECGNAVVGFDWEEIENEFGRLDSEDKAEILYRLEAYHDVFIIENNSEFEPDFDIHFEDQQ